MSNPPTSQALYRYHCLHTEVKGGDLHSPWISEQRTGLKYGADFKYSAGVIDEKQRDEILYALDYSPITEFKPLIYIMPYSDVQDLLKQAPLDKQARPTSLYYSI